MEKQNPPPGFPVPVEGMHAPVFYQMGGCRRRPIKYHHKQSLGIGVMMIVIGVLSIAFNGVSIGMNDVMMAGIGLVGYGAIGHGIWSGVLFIISGAFGLGAGCKQNKCLIISFMVLCIVSAAATTTLLSLGIIGAYSASTYPEWFQNCCSDCSSYYEYFYGYSYYYNGYEDMPPPCTTYKVVIAMESLMAIMALFAAIFAIWGSVLCCKAVACCSSKGRSDEARMMPQYCCSNHQMLCNHQQAPYYVLPASANQLNPPLYASQSQVPPYSQSEAVEEKIASSC